jgi:hypothetical protein
MDTALLVAVPEAEPVVAAWRARHDGSASRGVPAHVTILYPFVPRSAWNVALEAEARDVVQASGVEPFRATFARARRFPGVVYLEPSPSEPFAMLTAAFVRRWPEHPPYGGAFDAVPHLTVADDEGADADAIEADVRVHLPVVAEITAVWLMGDSPNGWEHLGSFELR